MSIKNRHPSSSCNPTASCKIIHNRYNTFKNSFPKYRLRYDKKSPNAGYFNIVPLVIEITFYKAAKNVYFSRIYVFNNELFFVKLKPKHEHGELNLPKHKKSS